MELEGEAVSDETVRRVLKCNELKPWLKPRWCIPPERNAVFVCQLEDVLDVYHRAYDPRFPQLCMDETSVQLLADARQPLPMRPGHPARTDYEYVRHGVCNLFLVVEPLKGRRHVAVTKRRTRRDWAALMREVADAHYADAERIILVLDNLNTHGPASFYEAFPPAEARRLLAADDPPRVLVLTDEGGDDRVRAAIGAGVIGYLLKDVGRDDLVRAIKDAAAGRPALHAHVQRSLMRQSSAPAEPSPLASLTARERALMRCLARGHSNRRIAAELGLTHGTVKVYVSALLDKLGVADRTQAALLAARLMPQQG